MMPLAIVTVPSPLSVSVTFAPFVPPPGVFASAVVANMIAKPNHRAAGGNIFTRYIKVELGLARSSRHLQAIKVERRRRIDGIREREVSARVELVRGDARPLRQRERDVC